MSRTHIIPHLPSGALTQNPITRSLDKAESVAGVRRIIVLGADYLRFADGLYSTGDQMHFDRGILHQWGRAAAQEAALAHIFRGACFLEQFSIPVCPPQF